MKYLKGLGFIAYYEVVFLGLPLLAWGLDDVRGFFSHPARLMFAIVVLLQSLFGSYLALTTPQADGSRKNVNNWFGYWRNIALETILVMSSYSDRHQVAVLGNATAIRYVGLILYVLGMVWIFWTVIASRRQYRLESPAPRGLLITTGPYRYIRHPRCLGNLLYATGWALVFQSWGGMAIVLLLVYTLVMWIKNEETFLRHEFGVKWAAYCSRSWRLVPFIY